MSRVALFSAHSGEHVDAYANRRGILIRFQMVHGAALRGDRSAVSADVSIGENRQHGFINAMRYSRVIVGFPESDREPASVRLRVPDFGACEKLYTSIAKSD